jgi:hypothetical protein
MSDQIVLGYDADRSEKPANLGLQELATGRTFLCAISGAGKSHTGRRISEQIFGQVGLIIVDVEGEYASLREKFPFLIIGKDLPLVPEAAEFLADQVLANELSVIIDGSDVSVDQATFQEFIQRFIDRFLIIETAKRKPYLAILEECDEIAPEHNFAKSLCGPAIMKLAKKGRKRGCGMLVVTQRPAAVAKSIISQCRNKLIGQLDWDPDREVVHRFARIPEAITDKLDKFERGDFYASGDFIAKPRVVHVGPVQTTHVGETPEIVPPAPKELATTLAKLNEQLPSIIKEQLAPAVPKVAEIEARVKEKFEAQWQARLQRVEKEKDGIKNKTEAKYETEIADLKRRLEDAARHSAMSGPVTDLLEHPLVKKNLSEKLSEKQEAFVRLLETRGPQDPEHCSLFLEVKPKSIPTFVHEVNRKIPKLIENIGGKYTSRLAKLFPVTEEAQVEVKESEKLRAQVVDFEYARDKAIQDRDIAVKNYEAIVDERNAALKEITRLNSLVKELTKNTSEKEFSRKEIPKTLAASGASGVSETRQTSVPPGDIQKVSVEATLKRTLTKFNVNLNTEILEADESTNTGKLLATGLRGFFSTKRPFGQVMDELFRKYGTNSDSGGSKDSVRESLAELVAKDILDRDGDAKHGWNYFATPHFTERVRPFQEAASR